MANDQGARRALGAGADATGCQYCLDGAAAIITAYLRARNRDIEAAAVERAAKGEG